MLDTAQIHQDTFQYARIHCMLLHKRVVGAPAHYLRRFLAGWLAGAFDWPASGASSGSEACFLPFFAFAPVGVSLVAFAGLADVFARI